MRSTPSHDPAPVPRGSELTLLRERISDARHLVLQLGPGDGVRTARCEVLLAQSASLYDVLLDQSTCTAVRA